MRNGKACYIGQDILDYLESVEIPIGMADSISARLRIKLKMPPVIDKRYGKTIKPVDPNKPYRADYDVTELAIGDYKIMPWGNSKYPYALGKAIKKYSNETGRRFEIHYSANGRKVTRVR